MICISCKIDRDSKDYYKSNLCYKCVYKEKINADKKEKRCRICDKKICKGRRVFCSDQCAYKNPHESWTRTILQEEKIRVSKNTKFRAHPWYNRWA